MFVLHWQYYINIMALFAHRNLPLESLIKIIWNINCQDNYVFERGIKITICF
jgi:hypothetical protein